MLGKPVYETERECTGECLSEETVKAVDSCVRDGAKCLMLDSLAPEPLKTNSGAGTCLIDHGQGQYLLTPDFRNETVSGFLKPYGGNANEIRYRFKEKDVVIKPFGGDKNRITVDIC